MQKEDYDFDGDTIYFMNVETGKKTLWDGLTEISSDDLEEELNLIVPQEVADKLNEAAVEACSAGQKINESLIAMLNEQAEMIRKGFVDAITETLTDDKSPNPIYIPKHIQHRKKGRR